MAERDYYIGTMGPMTYDDADTDTYPDGEATCAMRGSQVFLEDAASTGEHAVRKAEFDAALVSGYSGNIIVITNAQLSGGALEVKTRQLTFTDGRLTAVGAESSWTATPL